MAAIVVSDCSYAQAEEPRNGEEPRNSGSPANHCASGIHTHHLERASDKTLGKFSYQRRDSFVAQGC